MVYVIVFVICLLEKMVFFCENVDFILIFHNCFSIVVFGIFWRVGEFIDFQIFLMSSLPNLACH